jgi:Sulfotransferase domain
MRLGPLRPALRSVTRSARAQPTFLIIGAQKSGTTSLHRHLVQNPAVLSAERKELHYFEKQYARGDAWYLAQFPWRMRAMVVRRRVGVPPAIGEATPEYLFNPRVPERVSRFDASLRFVVVLRDPVDRAYSQYQMQVRKRGETRSFEELLELEKVEIPHEFERMRNDPIYAPGVRLRHSYVTRGFYAEQLERWFSFFDRESFLVLTSAELSRDPVATTAKVTGFLGIPEWTAEVYPRMSASNYEPMAPETRERLTHLFEPHNRHLEELLSRTFDWARPATTRTLSV